MLAMNQYGPDLGPQVATYAPNANNGLVECSFSAMTIIARVCADGVDITSSVTPQSALATPATLKRVSFPMPTGSSRLTIIAGGGSALQSSAESAALAVQCTSAASKAWNFYSSASLSPWQAITSQMPGEAVFADDVCSLNPSNLQSIVVASGVNWPGFPGNASAQPIWASFNSLKADVPMTQYIAFSVSVAGATLRPTTSQPTLHPSSGGSVTCSFAADNLVSRLCINGVDMTSRISPLTALKNYQITFPLPASSQPGRFTLVASESPTATQAAGIIAACSYPTDPSNPWNFVTRTTLPSSWRAILSNSTTANIFTSDVCSMNPSGQLNYIAAASSTTLKDAAATGAQAIWTPITVSKYTAFTYAVHAVVPAFQPSDVDFDQVYFSTYVLVLYFSLNDLKAPMLCAS